MIMMIAFLLAAVGDASSVVVDESASVSLLQLRSTCMSSSLTKHHEDKADACSTCSAACEECDISAATCYAGACSDDDKSWCWWYSTSDSDSAPSGFTECSDAFMLLARDNMTKKKTAHRDAGRLRTVEQKKTEKHKHKHKSSGAHLVDSKHGSTRSDQNVEGTALAQCSSAGMATTGYMRTGQCTEAAGDAGSHHICIDLQGATLGGQNFCQVTGQSNWCDEQGECQDNESEMCDRKDWCVCQWAFAGFLASGGSCDAMKVVCGATHMAALEAYRSDAAQYEAALKCLEQQCSI